MNLLYTFIYIFNLVVIIYFFFLNMGYIVINFFAFLDVKKYLREIKAYNIRDIFKTEHYLPVSIIVPAYNEEMSIIDTVLSLQSLNYNSFEIIVVSDGSTDGTIDKLSAKFQLTDDTRIFKGNLKTEKIERVISSLNDHLLIIEKRQGGKADAINAGLNAASYPLVTVIDADSILEQDALLKATYPFQVDSTVVAVGGIIRLANGCKIEKGELQEVGLPDSYLGRLQVIEYLRAFLFGRSGWNYVNSMYVISGAFGVFRKQILLDLGGYDINTVGEDIEIILRLHDHMNKMKKPYKIKFVPDPVCWTEAPENIKTLSRQRHRWQRGLMESMNKYKHMLFNKEYGFLGKYGFPFNYFLEMLSPVFEFIGYIVFVLAFLLGVVNWEFMLLFLFVSIFLGIFLSLSTIILEELSFRRFPKMSHLFILVFYSFLENLGFRQMHSYWRFMGFISYFKGEKTWGEMVRLGFSQLKSKSFHR